MSNRIAVATTLLCAGLVSYRLGEHGFWFDEGYTVGTVDRPLGDALWRIAHWELNQSPFLVLMIGWERVVDGEALLRALPAAFAVASVPLAYLLGTRLRDRTVGAVSAVLVSVHPFLVQWGQQLRSYSLVVMLLLAATLLLVRAVERPSTPRIVVYTLVAALAAYAHFFALFVLAAHAVSLLALRPLPRRLLVGASAFGAVLLLPLGEYLVNREGDPLHWVADPTRAQVMGTARAVAGGDLPQLVAYGLAVLLGFAAVAWVVRSSLRSDDPVEASLRRWRVLLPVLMLAVPPLGVLAASYTVKPLIEARFLIVAVPGLVLVAAIGVAWPRSALTVAATAALVVVSGFGLWDWYDRPPFEEWREAVAYVGARAGPGDLVVTAPARAVHVVGHYTDRQLVPVELGYPDDLDGPRPRQVFEVLDEDLRDTQPERPAAFAAWLAEHFEPVEERAFSEVVVRRHVAVAP